MEFFLSRNWGAAAFIDSGGSFNEKPENFETGAGVGIRWHTLIGPIRLDYARAITMEGEPWRIHLILGPDL
jgi:translocation and assembly module TamA